ncbi:hypothetical protein F4821DRAFT_166939 [Hypoxylon rubiginosum]|uniref:Uncharacterized protein n=1 Tax=Hypoxylon rubiginosum TaxID=110542 RepID=A0ACC0CWG0_9PEZI|nr:hypothetical protein F4821DRAFT_166939 [Hypoxylon rubiginosum]
MSPSSEPDSVTVEVGSNSGSNPPQNNQHNQRNQPSQPSQHSQRNQRNQPSQNKQGVQNVQTQKVQKQAVQGKQGVHQGEQDKQHASPFNNMDKGGKYGGYATLDEYDLNWSTNEDTVLFHSRNHGQSWSEIDVTLRRGVEQLKMRYKRVAEHVQARAAEGDKKSKKMAKAIDEDDLKDHDSKAKAKHTAGKNSAAKGKGSNDKKAKARATASASASSNTALPVGYPIADGPNRPLLKQLSASYRDKKFLTADKHFSVADCEALAVAEARVRTDYWLFIQAEFALMTGRVVSDEILKYKFENSQEESEEESEESDSTDDSEDEEESDETSDEEEEDEEEESDESGDDEESSDDE